MYHGIGASKGYGIGRVTIYREADLRYTPKSDCDAQTEKMQENRLRKSFSDI